MNRAKRPPVRGIIFVAVCLLAVTWPGARDLVTSSPAATDLLPDLIAVKSALYEHDFSTTIEPGRTHLRLSQLTANIGQGMLYFWGGANNGDGTQDVFQKIFQSGGGSYDVQAGTFVYHSGHGHVHFEGWAIYRLREILPGEGVGAVVATGGKTSFCVYDNTIHDPSLPGFDWNGEFWNCGGGVQGLGIGWGDTYDLTTEGQNIDVTDVPPGEYWLEAEVDPDSSIIELDDGNNIARIKVTIGSPSSINPDPYEPDQNFADLVGRPVGGFNSPVLGPCGPFMQVSDLTIHNSSSPDDYYEIYLPATGTMDDYVRIDFNHSLCNLRLWLYNESEVLLESENTSDDERNFENICLDGRGPGWYYLRVDAVTAGTSPFYELSIDPPTNAAPSVGVIHPPTGDVEIAKATETYQVTWSASDPDGNDTWVTVYLNTSPVLDGNEMMMFTSLNTSGSQGVYVLSTVNVPLGTYYVYCSVTDGGTVAGDWSDGTVTVIDENPTGADNAPELTSRLLPNVPNPFNPSTLLRVHLARAARVDWRIYNVGGQRIRTIATERLPAGPSERVWDGRDDGGRPVASGVYFNVVETADFRSMQKLVLLK